MSVPTIAVEGTTTASSNASRSTLSMSADISVSHAEMSSLIETVLREAFEDAVVVPSTAIVGTDNRFLRPLGIPSYGFIPCLLSQEERDGFHANDEFLTVENFNLGLEVMFEVVRRFCAAP